MKIVRHNIGDKVVALTNPPDNHCQPRIKGKIYTINSVRFCVKCGIQSVNISGKAPNNFIFLECMCGVDSNGDGLWWTQSNMFAKVDNVEEAIEEAVENEDYELAVVLRDLEPIEQ